MNLPAVPASESELCAEAIASSRLNFGPNNIFAEDVVSGVLEDSHNCCCCWTVAVG